MIKCSIKKYSTINSIPRKKSDLYHYENYCMTTYVQHFTFIKKNFEAMFQKIKDSYFDTQNKVQ